MDRGSVASYVSMCASTTRHDSIAWNVIHGCVSEVEVQGTFLARARHLWTFTRDPRFEERSRACPFRFLFDFCRYTRVFEIDSRGLPEICSLETYSALISSLLDFPHADKHRSRRPRNMDLDTLDLYLTIWCMRKYNHLNLFNLG